MVRLHTDRELVPLKAQYFLFNAGKVVAERHVQDENLEILCFVF